MSNVMGYIRVARSETLRQKCVCSSYTCAEDIKRITIYNTRGDAIEAGWVLTNDPIHCHPDKQSEWVCPPCYMRSRCADDIATGEFMAMVSVYMASDRPEEDLDVRQFHNALTRIAKNLGFKTWSAAHRYLKVRNEEH